MPPVFAIINIGHFIIANDGSIELTESSPTEIPCKLLVNGIYVLNRISDIVAAVNPLSTTPWCTVVVVDEEELEPGIIGYCQAVAKSGISTIH